MMGWLDMFHIKSSIRFFILAWMLVVAGQAAIAKQAQTQLPAGRTFEFNSYVQVDELFKQHDYTPETWHAGVRAVPRLYLTTIPPRWRDKVSKEVSVATKKRLFFRALAPLVLRANELISEERKKLVAIKENAKQSDAEREWLANLAVRYRVIKDVSQPVQEQKIDELLQRVDTIPVSLVLAQSAEESGWGTSRFAALGNAMFGQWTWGGEGIKPEQQRSGKGDYKIAAFKTPQDSVNAYMRNLNTHRAYQALRERRVQIREQGDAVTGAALVVTLVNYSERGEEYVKSLQAIMRVNKLAPADEAYLKEMEPVYMVPVGTGS